MGSVETSPFGTASQLTLVIRPFSTPKNVGEGKDRESNATRWWACCTEWWLLGAYASAQTSAREKLVSQGKIINLRSGHFWSLGISIL